MNVDTPTAKPRIIAIDAARGIALFGMFAVHTLQIFERSGEPTFVTTTAAGRSAATFALLAGVSLALMTGGSKPLQGKSLSAAKVGVAIRALIIGTLGLLLGLVVNIFDVNIAGILVYYGIAFLFVIPMLGWRKRTLIGFAMVTAIIAPALIYFVRPALPDRLSSDPTIFTPFTDPVSLISTLTITGSYPIIALLAYLAAGIAIGRLDLRSLSTAGYLLAIGSAVAVVSWIASSVLLFNLGGREELFEASNTEFGSINETTNTTLWWPVTSSDTLWELAQRAPHSYSFFDLTHTIGFAAALVGALMLITHHRLGELLLKPLSIPGSMPLTIYSYHVMILAAWYFFTVHPPSLWVFMVLSSVVLAAALKAMLGHGPLEAVVANAARRARNRMSDRQHSPV